MIIKRINPSGRAKTLALGQPRSKGIVHVNDGFEVTFDIGSIDPHKSEFYRIQISKAQLELLLEVFTQYM